MICRIRDIIKLQFRQLTKSSQLWAKKRPFFIHQLFSKQPTKHALNCYSAARSGRTCCGAK